MSEAGLSFLGREGDADNTQLSFPSHPKETVVKWMKAKTLKLKPDKIKVLLASPNSTLIDALSPVLGGVTCPLKGVTLGSFVSPGCPGNSERTASFMGWRKRSVPPIPTLGYF